VVSYTESIKSDKIKNEGVVMGIYSGWDSFLLKYGGEVFLERRSIFCMINISLLFFSYENMIVKFFLKDEVSSV
jgi:hypothetical protein